MEIGYNWTGRDHIIAYRYRKGSLMQLLSTLPVKKLDLGFHGNLFGGKLLSWIDAAVAGLCHGGVSY